MNPAPCIPIEAQYPVWVAQTKQAAPVNPALRVYTIAQIRKSLLRVWMPGSPDYFLWIPTGPRYENCCRSPYKRWWQPQVSA